MATPAQTNPEFGIPSGIGGQIPDKTVEAGNAAIAKINDLSINETGKTAEDNVQNISESASKLANDAVDYAKGIANAVSEKANQALESVEKSDIGAQAEKGLQATGSALEGLVQQTRVAVGQALDAAANALNVSEKKTDEGIDVAVGASASYIDQARNTIATGLKKAEDLVVGAAAKTENAAAGTAAEPYTSNLMEGAKQTASSIDDTADSVATKPLV